jgi:hypothetical protein
MKELKSLNEDELKEKYNEIMSIRKKLEFYNEKLTQNIEKFNDFQIDLERYIKEIDIPKIKNDILEENEVKNFSNILQNVFDEEGIEKVLKKDISSKFFQIEKSFKIGIIFFKY